MNNVKEKLFSEFPPVSTEAWMEKITVDLKGASFEKKLVWKTNEGFNVRPFYRKEDLGDLQIIDSLPSQFPYIRGTKMDNDWYVRQDINVTDFSVANHKALDIINKGVNSLGFKISGNAVCKENIAVLLEEILPEAVELNFSTCNMQSVNLIKILAEYFKEQKYDITKIHGSVNIDFIGVILQKGHIKKEWLREMTDAISVASEFKYFKVLAINPYLFNNAGSFITQELGYALAWGNELLSRLMEVGIDPAVTAGKIKFNFGIGSNYFMEIAKFRCARWLWAEIVKAYKSESKDDFQNGDLDGECNWAAKMNIFAQTSTFNQTIFDTYVNLLRTQTEAMSASIAGVNSLLVRSFDEVYNSGNDSDFSERIARNQQLLLKEESHFDKVTDVSGGSYYIEMLTQSIAQEAWRLFLDVEEKGFYEMVKSGEIQQEVNVSANKRFNDLARRSEILLGTNQYPNFTEKLPINFRNETPTNACPTGCGILYQNVKTVLNSRRLSEAFENLRLITERSGREVKAFMLTIGNLAMRLARSQFSSNFLACAGYKIIDNLGFETIEQGIDAARKAGADIIVLCSSDDEYITYAPAVYKLINSKEILIVAGAPACMEELKAQGIINFINIKSNLLETLEGLNTKLGIK